MTSLNFDQLDRESQSLISEAMAILGEWWDDEVGLIRQTDDEYPLPLPNAPHMIRESVMYALGLLIRSQPGDIVQANRIIKLALTYQFNEPDQPYHGTFYRFPEEPHPPAHSLIWRDYDPNWREFIGCTFVIILQEFSNYLESGVEDQINVAIERIIAGTLARKLPTTYTNIVLMKAFMLVFAGERFGKPEWSIQGEQLAEEIYQLFSETDCFGEYNSPTYYGVDLAALGMWVRFSSSPRLQELGARMEALLWQEIARFYHAGLKNICGPFDRSYGMDMCKYVTSLGMSMRLGLGKDLAPVPDTRVSAKNFNATHKNDLSGAVWAVSVGVRIPEEARRTFREFEGERSVKRIISKAPLRIATAWLSPNLMLGAEDANGTKPVWSQYHLATMHWRYANQGVAWLKLINNLPADAVIEKNQMQIKSFVWHGLQEQERFFIFQVFIPALSENVQIERSRWQLSNLRVEVETNTEGPFVTQDGQFINIRYEANHMDGGSPIFFKLIVE